MRILADFWQGIQGLLFTAETLWQCSLSDKQKQLIAILEVVRIEEFVEPVVSSVGRTPHDRRLMARAFVAKAVCGYPMTKALREALREQASLRQICGWYGVRRIPSESTFSRAFAEFAQSGLGSVVHESLVKEWVDDTPVMHVSRDSTEVRGRERALRKPKRTGRRPETHKVVLSDGRQFKGTRLEIQREQSLDEALRDLPKACDAVKKKDSSANWHTLVGYKLHTDWADGMVPLSTVLTSASVHDSQAAIPLARMTAKRATVLYELMDQAYDAQTIRAECVALGHVPLIDRQRSRKDYSPWDPASAARFGHRTNAERGHSRLQEEFGLRQVRVRGHAKVLLHVMFGVLALFADQVTKPLTG